MSITSKARLTDSYNHNNNLELFESKAFADGAAYFRTPARYRNSESDDPVDSVLYGWRFDDGSIVVSSESEVVWSIIDERCWTVDIDGEEWVSDECCLWAVADLP